MCAIIISTSNKLLVGCQAPKDYPVASCIHKSTAEDGIQIQAKVNEHKTPCLKTSLGSSRIVAPAQSFFSEGLMLPYLMHLSELFRYFCLHSTSESAPSGHAKL